MSANVPDLDEITVVVDRVVREYTDRIYAAVTNGDRPMTRQQTADYLQLHPDTVSRLTKAGKIPCIQLTTGERRWYRDQVDRALRRDVPGNMPDKTVPRRTA